MEVAFCVTLGTRVSGSARTMAAAVRMRTRLCIRRAESSDSAGVLYTDGRRGRVLERPGRYSPQLREVHDVERPASPD